MGSRQRTVDLARCMRGATAVDFRRGMIKRSRARCALSAIVLTTAACADPGPQAVTLYGWISVTVAHCPDGVVGPATATTSGGTPSTDNCGPSTLNTVAFCWDQQTTVNVDAGVAGCDYFGEVAAGRSLAECASATNDENRRIYQCTSVVVYQ